MGSKLLQLHSSTSFKTTLFETMASGPPDLPGTGDEEPRYGGYSRFEIECEFVTSLGNPTYMQWLSTQSYWKDARFVAYLDYLQYWKQPPYTRYLMFPGPTLKALELLQKETFRDAISRPEVAEGLKAEWMRAAVEFHKMPVPKKVDMNAPNAST